MKVPKWKIKALSIFSLLLCLPNLSFGKFHYRPEYAQVSDLAYTQALSYASIILPYGTNNIMQSPSFLYDVGESSLMGGYGNSQYSTHIFDLAYVSPLLGENSNLVFGLEYIINFIPANTEINNNYFEGIVSNFGFEQVLTSALAYSFGNSGTFGINVKFPFDSYKKGTLDGGVLVNASYDLNFFGFDFMVGLANIGGMYVNHHLLGVYPDVQAGIGYSYVDSNDELIFNLGMSLENNLGELIGNSFVFGIGGRIRLFSTGLLKSKPLIEDDILSYRDARDSSVTQSVDTFLSTLSANLYLNIGFQFSGTPHFSIGFSSEINSYMLDLGVIFPDSKTKRFGAYVSFGRTL